MNIKVKYFTKTGNTKKLADRIARTVGVHAETVGNGKDDEADILFLGASVYWAGIDSEVKKYIEELNPSKIKQVAIFSTSALAERAFPDIKKRLEKKNIKVNNYNFYCRGKFTVMHQGRPNEKDLKDAETFAKKIIENIVSESR